MEIQLLVYIDDDDEVVHNIKYAIQPNVTLDIKLWKSRAEKRLFQIQESLCMVFSDKVM